MIKVKYSKEVSHGEYDYKSFEDYGEFGYWYTLNYRSITIWNIEA